MKHYKMTATIVAVCVALQCLQSLCPAITPLQAFDLSNFLSPTLLPLAVITIFTHMFSHAGFQHLLGNMMLGVPVMLFLEHKMGSVRLLQVYLLCGLAALGTECCMPLSQGVMIGASGAIMGCFAASCAIMKKGPLLGALSLGLLFLSTVPNLQGLSMALLGGNIAYAAHIGGVLMGLFLMAGKQKKST